MNLEPNKPKITIDLIQAHMADLANQIESETVLDKWKALRMTNESRYPIPEPMISINGESIATAGNLMVISGIQKSAKTSISMIFLSGFIRGSIEPIDGVPSEMMIQPAGTKANLHFDTEQAKHKYLSNIKAMGKRLGKTEIPKNLYAYSLRGQSIDDSLAIIESTFILAKQECGDIHSCFIDGIADLVNSVNDELESNKIIKFFEDLATNYNCLVVAVIHRNPNDSKVRGHLGSQLLRKAEAILCVKKENDLSYIEPEDLRTASNGDIPKLMFQYQKDKGYHVCIGENSQQQQPTKIEMFENLLDIIFNETETFKYSELANLIAKFTSKSEESAKKYIKEMMGLEMIFCPKRGLYQRLIIEEN